jgi:hypothetical protein
MVQHSIEAIDMQVKVGKHLIKLKKEKLMLISIFTIQPVGRGRTKVYLEKSL